MRFCVNEGCITLPREVESILDDTIDVCGNLVRLSNPWYEYGAYSWGKRPRSTCAPVRCVAEFGVYTGYADVPAGCVIRLYPSHADDVGKTVTLLGYDTNNLWVRTKVGGVWQDGETVTLAAPFAVSTTEWRLAGWVATIKEETDTDVTAFAYNATTMDETALARFQPTETKPSYRRYRIDPWANICCASECPEDEDGYRTINLLAKLTFIPAAKTTDFLLIPNIPALSEMCLAIRARDSGDQAGYLQHRINAVRILNDELEMKTGRRDNVVVDRFGPSSMRTLMRGFC
jgi:hypothetical protein